MNLFPLLPELLSRNVEPKMMRKLQEMADSEGGREDERREEKGN